MNFIDLLEPVTKGSPFLASLLRELHPVQPLVILNVSEVRKNKKKTWRLIRPGLQPKSRIVVGAPITKWTVGETPLPDYNEQSARKTILISKRKQKKPPRAPLSQGEPMRYWMGVGGGQRSQWGDYNAAEIPPDSLIENRVTLDDGRRIMIGGDRGHGGLVSGSTMPPTTKPVVLVLGGSFNPPHIGHRGIANEAVRLVREAGYSVPTVVVAPTADKLIKDKLPDRMSLADRTELAKLTFTESNVKVTSAPAEEAEKTEGKLRRTQLADWAAKEYPGHTVINITGEDSAPGHPPGYPSVYQGDQGTAHEGYYYLALPRPAGGMSSTKIRQALSAGEKLLGMTPEAEKLYLKLGGHRQKTEQQEEWVEIDAVDLLEILIEAGEHWITKEGNRILIGGNGRYAGKIILFDENGSLRGNIKKASEELHLRYTKTKGHVRFIGEQEYAKVQDDFNKTKTKAEGEEIHHRDPSYLLEADQGSLEELTEAGGERWITVGGRHVLIGGDRRLTRIREGQSTEDKFFNKRTKKWTKARADLHEAVTEHMVAGKLAPTGRKPIAYIIGGGTATGKTTTSTAVIGENPNALRIDPDELKLAVPEFEHLKQTDPNNAARLVHEESSQMTKLALAKAINRKLDFTYDSTTSGNGSPEFIKTLYDNGYDVRGIFVDIPIATAISRAAWRERNSPNPINRGRRVPVDIIRQSGIGAAKNFFELKDDPHLTSIRFFDNSGKTHRLIYERVAGGQERIHDHARFKQYARKAKGLSEKAEEVRRFIRPGSLPGFGGREGFAADDPGRKEETGGLPELILEIRANLALLGAALMEGSR